jgi:hypothetical protein
MGDEADAVVIFHAHDDGMDRAGERIGDGGDSSLEA